MLLDRVGVDAARRFAMRLGFEPDQLEEPRIEEKLKANRKRGWGLKIIEGLMDEVEVKTSSRGTTVRMTKSRQPEKAS